MRVPAPLAVAAATAALIASTLASAPLVAAAGPIVITADQPAAVPSGHLWAYNDFFPRHVNVVQGQTIGFAIEGFHTATLLPKGTTSQKDLQHQGIATADEDTTLNANGTSHVAIDLPAVMPTDPSCGTAAKPCSFDGSSVVSSGAPLAGPPAGPFMVTVNAAPGTYEFHCRIHPRMSGLITVVSSSSGATTPSQLATAVAKQTALDKAAGFAAERRASAGSHVKNSDGSSTWFVTPGAQSGDGHVAVLEFLPRHISVKQGDRVVWRMSENTEPHTVTFPTDLHTDQVPMCEPAGGGGGADVGAVPTVIPPTGPQDFTCPTGAGPLEIEFGAGNAVRTINSPQRVSDSGILGSVVWQHAFGLPSTSSLTRWSVRFADSAVKGTYHYVCQIHEGMEATITVH